MQSVFQIMFARHANLPHVSSFQQRGISYCPSELHVKVRNRVRGTHWLEDLDIVGDSAKIHEMDDFCLDPDFPQNFSILYRISLNSPPLLPFWCLYQPIMDTFK